MPRKIREIDTKTHVKCHSKWSINSQAFLSYEQASRPIVSS